MIEEAFLQKLFVCISFYTLISKHEKKKIDSSLNERILRELEGLLIAIFD